MKTNYIYFTKSERRGVLIFFIIMLIIIIGSNVWHHNNLSSPAIAQQEIRDILAQEGKAELAELPHTPDDNLTQNSIDPNTATEAQLKSIGMTSYAVKSLLGYRKHKHFNNEQDLGKVYGIDSTMIKEIRPYLKFDKETLASKSVKPENPALNKSRPILTPIDPNTASPKELMSIGFSQFSANNIIKLRSKGGSFKDLDAIKRVYGVNESTYNKVKDLLLFPNAEEVNPQAVFDTTSANNKITTKPADNFNPNTADYKELVAQGIPSKIANTIIKFRKGEDTFQSANDLLKIYGINDSFVDIFRDRITIPKKDSIISLTSTDIETIVDLSTTTSEELLGIEGIGPYFSKAIIEYRDKLGGYHNVEQLAEVPAMKDEIYQKIKNNFVVKGKIKKFVPISLEFKEALAHPYMDFKTTKLLFNLSANNYNTALDKLIKKGMVDSRLIPYLLAE